MLLVAIERRVLGSLRLEATVPWIIVAFTPAIEAAARRYGDRLLMRETA